MNKPPSKHVVTVSFGVPAAIMLLGIVGAIGVVIYLATTPRPLPNVAEQTRPMSEGEKQRADILLQAKFAEDHHDEFKAHAAKAQAEMQDRDATAEQRRLMAEDLRMANDPYNLGHLVLGSLTVGSIGIGGISVFFEGKQYPLVLTHIAIPDGEAEQFAVLRDVKSYLKNGDAIWPLAFPAADGKVSSWQSGVFSFPILLSGDLKNPMTLQEKLISDGMSPYLQSPFPAVRPLHQRYIEAETKARKNKLGFWAPSATTSVATWMRSNSSLPNE